VEVILFVAPGSTDLPLNGVMFMTEGVGDFMTSIMDIDNQDLLSKMEGFAIQGMKGMSCPLRHLADPHIPIGACHDCDIRSPCTLLSDRVHAFAVCL